MWELYIAKQLGLCVTLCTLNLTLVIISIALVVVSKRCNSTSTSAASVCPVQGGHLGINRVQRTICLLFPCHLMQTRERTYHPLINQSIGIPSSILIVGWFLSSELILVPPPAISISISASSSCSILHPSARLHQVSIS